MSEIVSPQIKTLILTDNDKGVLPAGVNILSVAVDGFISVTSTCNNLPTPVPYKCYQLEFATDIPDDGGTDLFNEDNITYYGIRVNNIDVLFSSPLTSGGDTIALENAIKLVAPYLKNVAIATIGNNPPSYRDRILTFKAPENMGNNFQLLLGTSGFGSESRMTVAIKAFEISC
jgi:hypothetical protein